PRAGLHVAHRGPSLDRLAGESADDRNRGHGPGCERAALSACDRPGAWRLVRTTPDRMGARLPGALYRRWPAALLPLRRTGARRWLASLPSLPSRRHIAKGLDPCRVARKLLRLTTSTKPRVSRP